MGTFTAKDRKVYQNICHLSERGVLSYMKDLLTSKYGQESVIATPSYIVCIGDLPVALVAHADTVFSRPPIIDNFFYDQEKDVIWNPDGAGADDRAGVFSISKIIKSTNLRPHVIITTGEESGCIGAGKLVAHMRDFPGDLRFMIQLDRRGHNDSVFYDCMNYEFEDWINKYGFQTEWGSFTDISVLAPAWKVAAVNFSIGYEDEHHEIERLHVDWMFETIAKTINILTDVANNIEGTQKFIYIESSYSWHYRPHSAWYDYDDDLPMPEGFDHCFMCNQLEKKVDMIQVWYPKGIRPYNLCMECYGDLVHQIVWCKECNRGIFLSSEEARKIPDVNNWICEDCKDGKHRNYQNAGETSTGVQSGNSRVPLESVIPGLAKEQAEVHQYDEIDDLCSGYASDL